MSIIESGAAVMLRDSTVKKLLPEVKKRFAVPSSSVTAAAMLMLARVFFSAVTDAPAGI